MKFEIEKKILLYFLQKVSNLITKNTLSPILENILIEVKKNTLFLTATNLESEIQVNTCNIIPYIQGSVTVSGKKLLAVCRKLSLDSNIIISLKKDKLEILSKLSFYSLTTIPSDNYPSFKQIKHKISFFISQNSFKNIIFTTQFSIAIQDLRNFFSGLLLEIRNQHLYAIATDGYRMAMCKTPLKHLCKFYSVILPRKCAIELLRFLNNSSNLAFVKISNNYFQIHVDNTIFTSKILTANFPKYSSVILKNPEKKIIINTFLFKEALSRIIILSNEKFRGICITNDKNQLKITTSNQYDEKAYEILEIIYSNVNIKVSINAHYLLDVLNVIESQEICLFINNSNSRIQIQQNDYENYYNYKSIYILMPLKI
ncbi:MAG: DNA polymerase III subunit beta [Buchnera aphidicola (Nurudea yanoniella)]